MHYACVRASVVRVSTEIIQVRDVPANDARVLRERARARNLSMSAYLRELIHTDASRPAMEEVLARIAQREPVEVDAATIRAFIDDSRC